MSLFFSKKSRLFWDFPEWLGPLQVFFPLRWCLYRLQYPCPVRCGHRFGPRWWRGTCQAGKWGEEMDWGNDTLMAKESGWCVFWVTFFIDVHWIFIKSDLTTCFHGAFFYGSSNLGLDSEWMGGSVVNSPDPPIFRPHTRKKRSSFNGWRLELSWVTHNHGFSETWVYLQ